MRDSDKREITVGELKYLKKQVDRLAITAFLGGLVVGFALHYLVAQIIPVIGG